MSEGKRNTVRCRRTGVAVCVVCACLSCVVYLLLADKCVVSVGECERRRGRRRRREEGRRSRDDFLFAATSLSSPPHSATPLVSDNTRLHDM